MSVEEIGVSAAKQLIVIKEISHFLRQHRAASLEEIGAVVDCDSESVKLALEQMRRDGLVNIRASHLDEDQIAISTDLLLRNKR